MSDASNPDITHFALFNLGTMLEANCLDDEATSTYRAAPNKKVQSALTSQKLAEVETG